jgi:hypothetical protein
MGITNEPFNYSQPSTPVLPASASRRQDGSAVEGYERPATSNERLIMQNKANLLVTKMNVSPVLTEDYENVRYFSREKNKPKQTQPVVSLPALSKVKVSNHTPPILLAYPALLCYTSFYRMLSMRNLCG